MLVVVFVADQLDWFEASKTKPMLGAPIAMAAMAADEPKASQPRKSQVAPQVQGWWEGDCGFNWRMREGRAPRSRPRPARPPSQFRRPNPGLRARRPPCNGSERIGLPAFYYYLVLKQHTPKSIIPTTICVILTRKFHSAPA